MNKFERKILFSRLSIILLVSFLMISEGIANLTADQEKINWDKLFMALKGIEEDASRKNIFSFLSLIPEQYTQNQVGDERKFLDAIDSSKIFEQLLVNGDPLIAESAFRLMAFILPGAYYEDFFIMLGKLATNYPKLFLEMLNKYKNNFEYEYPVTMTEILDIVPDVVTEEDSRRRYLEELRLYEKRLQALSSVTDEELTEVRDRCIKEIEKIIMDLKSRIKETLCSHFEKN